MIYPLPLDWELKPKLEPNVRGAGGFSGSSEDRLLSDT